MGALLVKQIGKTDANKSKLINIVHQQRALEESRHYWLQRAFLLIWPPSNVVTKCRVLTSRAAFAWRSKLFPVGLPNNFIAFIWGRHLALSIGRLVMPQGRTPRERSEISETEITFLDTKAYKEVRFDKESILDVQTHCKPTETFQYTNFYSCHPQGVKKGFIKGEALRLLRTNSSRITFERDIWNFYNRLLERGYPARYFRKYLSEVKFADMKTALQQRNKSKSKKLLPFATQYHPALPSLRRIHMWK